MAGRFVICCIAIFAVSLLDYATGTELRVYPLYMLPISYVAWGGSFEWGLAASLTATVAWLVSNALAGTYSTGVWIVNSFAQLVAFSVVVVLVVHLQRSRDAATKLARTDELTGAWNSRAFREFVSQELDRLGRYGHPFLLVYVDLDNFKVLNDKWGHAAGDEALQLVAEAMRTALRTTDFVSRMGGDEFALLLPETDATAAPELLDRVREQILAAMRERGWPVTASIGALTIDEAEMSIDELIGRADALMYEVKRAGRNDIRIDAFRQDVA